MQIYQKQFVESGDNIAQNNEKRITHISEAVNIRGEKFKSYSTREQSEKQRILQVFLKKEEPGEAAGR